MRKSETVGEASERTRISLLVENAAVLPERIESSAARGASVFEVVRPEEKPAWDALVHFSSEYLDHVRLACVGAARKARGCLVWRTKGFARYDFRKHAADPVIADRLAQLPTWRPGDYQDLIRRMHATLTAAVASDATVIVVSKGDPAILCPPLHTEHFPQDPNGDWAGHHPVDSAAAIEALQRSINAGADHLVLPATAFWWFDHYTGFVDHLTSTFHCVVEDADSCVVFALTSNGQLATRKPAANKRRINGSRPAGGRNGRIRRNARISLEQRLATERRNLALREAALIAGRTDLPGPYEAHIGFSNVCNMSCVMCLDGSNPPARRISAELLARIGEQVAPSLSVITPYDASEPLIATWDETRAIAEDNSIELCLTTNVQFLDEEKFREVEPITETLFLSIDSHDPEIFEKIRPRSRPERVFANLHTAARLSRQRGLECLANVVFMAENAPVLPETVAYLADAGLENVHVLHLMDVNGRNGLSNPLIHFSEDYVDSIRERCVAVARAKRIRLHWDVAGGENHDFRPAGAIRPKPRKVRYDHWDWRMRHYVPGYCRNVYDRVRITIDGMVAPCSYSSHGQLELGNLAEQDFDAIWNGPTAQDLRRAHATWDYPGNCATCRLKDPRGPERNLPFVDQFRAALGARLDDREPGPSLTLVEPAHMTRTESAPVFRIEEVDDEIVSYCLVIALGGESDHLIVHSPQPQSGGSDVIEFELSRDEWARLRPNLGYWWTVFGLGPDTEVPQRVVRSAEIRCLIRHEPVPRLAGSGLIYPGDPDSPPPVNLGALQEPGLPRSNSS